MVEEVEEGGRKEGLEQKPAGEASMQGEENLLALSPKVHPTISEPVMLPYTESKSILSTLTDSSSLGAQRSFILSATWSF